MATPTKDQALALYEEVKKTRARVLEQNPNLITLIHSVATKGRELHYLFQNFKMDNIEIWDDPNNEPRRAAETALNYLEILTRYVVDYEMRVLQEGGCEDLAVAIERVDWDSTEEADRLYSSLIRRAATLTSLKRYYTPILKLINRAIKAINTVSLHTFPMTGHASPDVQSGFRELDRRLN